MSPRPMFDDLPESPVDWEPIMLGPGQSPSAYGGNGSFQFTSDADPFIPADSVRRNPDETFLFIIHVPERP